MLTGIRILIGLLLLFLFTQLQIEVPLLDVDIPITGQSFIVLLIPYIFGRIQGVLTILLYLIIGLLGFPVFALGGNGLDAFTAHSGGYLIGFIFGAYASGYISDFYPNSFKVALCAMFIGTLLILLTGVLKLSFELGFLTAIQKGFNPFILAGIIKIIAGAFLGWLIKKYILTLEFKF